MNALWDLPVGNRTQGVSIACLPERLHQYEGGLIVHFFIAFMEFFKSQYTESSVNEAIRQLDMRSKKVSKCNYRHSDRSVPSKHFRKGITDFTFLTSQEFPKLLILLINTIGNQQKVVLRRSKEKLWLELSWELLVVWKWLKKDSYARTELPNLQTRIIKMLRLYKRVAGPYIPSGCKFPKYHLTLHYVKHIQLFGPPNLSYGGFWERSLQYYVKKQYRRTTKHTDSAPDEIRKRHRLLTAFTKKYDDMEEYEHSLVRNEGILEETTGTESHLGGSSIANVDDPKHILKTHPAVYRVVVTCFKDVYNYNGPLRFRTEAHVRLKSENFIFRATSSFHQKRAWFDWAELNHPVNGKQLVQIFSFIESPQQNTRDLLMVCSIVELCHHDEPIPLKKYRKIHTLGRGLHSTHLKYEIFPLSYILRPAFVIIDPDDSNFVRHIPSEDRWLQSLETRQPLPPIQAETRNQEYQVHSLLKSRQKQSSRHRTQQTEYLVRWKNYHLCESSWNKKSDICSLAIDEYEDSL